MGIANRIHPQPERRRLIAIGAVGILIVGLLAFLGVDRAVYGVALEDARDEAQAEAAILAAGLESELDKFSLVPLVLARDPQVRALLAGDTSETMVLNRRLEELAGQTGAAAIYLMDTGGTTQAASNWNRQDSFVGSNYGFRRYFRNALEEGAATQFALGTVSRRPGLYLARRVDLGDGAVGVVAAKVEFDRLEGSWQQAAQGVFVTDADGIVLIASNPDWRFRTTRPVPPGSRDAPFDQRQFGTARLLPMQLGGRGADLIALPLIETLQPLSPQGWELHFLADPSPRLAAARANGRLALLLGLIGLVAIIAAAAIVQRRRERRAEALAKERTVTLRDQLQQANRLATLGQITAGVGHEIRQPLAAMRVYAENGERLVEAGDIDGAAANFSRIVALTERLGRITDELRQFSRRGMREPRNMPIRQVIDGALLLLRDRMNRLGTTLELPDDALLDIAVKGEHVALEQVLVNLLQNALDATGPSGRIAISIASTTTQCRLSVADNGPGIAAEMRAGLFQPFATTKDSGLGLGLVISQDIMRSLGGDLEADEPACGARFTMMIPRA
jgi:two-component system C4-dicarboxylate transport sensor histidine kinase DctB